MLGTLLNLLTRKKV